MPLHPKAQAIVDGVAAMGLPPMETLPIDDQRAAIAGFANFMVPTEDVESVEDVDIPGPEMPIPARIYTPVTGAAPRPVILYFHGGGFCTGDLDLTDPMCRRLANRSESVVVSIDYHLAPEHPYPAAVLDSYVATAWVAVYGHNFGVDGSRVALLGDSAGANLATAAAMLIRDKADEIEIKVQMLICPVTDMVKFDTPSYEEFGQGDHLLSRAMMEHWRDLYLTSDELVGEPYNSPVRMPNLQDLPPAIIITAECDPLRDEGEAYGELLRANGNLVDVRREPGMVHNFHWMGGVIDRGRELIDEIGADLKAVLYAG